MIFLCKKYASGSLYKFKNDLKVKLPPRCQFVFRSLKIIYAVIGTSAIPLLLCAGLCLNGCASRQEIDPGFSPQETRPQHDKTLSDSELKALQSTQEIDKNVPAAEMDDVTAQYKHYLRKGRKTMCVLSKRSEPYLAYARKVFRDRNMPEELANLAIVESGYKADAKSTAGAAGAWQFMPQTGMKYGLSQDWWQDDRLDIYKSTEAAADYLQKLYNDFGDWPTAIAAYNAGEGKISRAKQGTGARDFFEVKALNHMLDEKAQLRDETRQYVPKFMAISKIMRKLPELGFDDVDPESAEPVRRLTAYPGMDLKAFSNACDLAWADFYRHNQHHKRNITCTDRETYIYVPMRAEKKAQEYLCTSKNFSYAGWKPLKVLVKGDSLEKISKRASVPLEKLRTANPGLNKLQAGQIILAPANVDMSPRSFAANNKKSYQPTTQRANTIAVPNSLTHTIRNNETLYSIARKYGVDVAQLKTINGIDDPGKLRSGQNLSIPGKRGSVVRPKKQPIIYKVQAKDNLWKIARMHKISVDDIKRWNNIDEKNLKAGATIIVAKE